ncbi:HAD-IA family hydrolase [Silvimonas amylolytica]|uniref:Glycerol-3-phosphatase n=1 Tax=Silvimonas amylolytica TaxID=449663 RepID=A0ABQ2PI38_9NEIS|nr:HAD-IA family hydrolase [Silvimonas amylolytica]GGP25273.1 glycerol-3-phosphatase [Silvimonas amylolytica]
MSTQPLFPRTFSAFLFDMDGTILSSIAAAEKVWGDWAREHGLDVATFLPTIHGVRAIETIKKQQLPGIDEEAEAAKILQGEIDYLEGIEPIAGVARFLASLPKDRWAVVTSATRELAEKRIAAAGLPMPPLMVCGEDVERGKPAPDCFELGARKLGVNPAQCVVFEDAPAGIAGGEAAGATVVVITATHSHPIDTTNTCVPNYEALSIAVNADGSLSLMTRD